MFGVHPEEGSSAPDLVGDGHGFPWCYKQGGCRLNGPLMPTSL